MKKPLTKKEQEAHIREAAKQYRLLLKVTIGVELIEEENEVEEIMNWMDEEWNQ